tara:strand:+ start:86 stop:1165 length:1080 start_codon:yes stop_codon:yes gene_type:complete
MRTKIVATEYNPSQAEGMKEGSIVNILSEPDNVHDNKALSVVFNNETIGFIGKGTDLYESNRNLFPMTAKVVDFYIREPEDAKFKNHEVGNLVSCNIEVEDIVELDPSNDVKSFNEEGVVINFDEVPHIYTYEGRILKGATTYIKRYIAEFDSSTIIPRCVSSWGVEASVIRKAWALSGNLSATFGTAIHKALEFEDLYRHYTKKTGDRCFTIKHPTISRIVEEFYALYQKLGFKGEVIPEALISDVENGHCALGDRIVITNIEEKRCRLQDYKVNHSFDKKGEVKFVNLPNGLTLPTTKLSKLSLQLKFQAQMMEKSGWTVEGFDGFVYTDKWEYYTADTLEGFDIIEGTYNQNLLNL